MCFHSFFPFYIFFKQQNSLSGEVEPWYPCVVSWTSPKTGRIWKAGSDELFYSPEFLGLVDVDGVAYDDYVPIEKLCWILDPKLLFAKVMLNIKTEFGDDSGNMEKKREATKTSKENTFEEISEKVDEIRENIEKKGFSIGDRVVFKDPKEENVQGFEAGEVFRVREVLKDGRGERKVEAFLERLPEAGPQILKMDDLQRAHPWWLDRECWSLLIEGDTERLQETRFWSKFYELRRLAEYYCEIINTFAEMSLGRNYGCIHFFERTHDSDGDPLAPLRYEMLVSSMANKLLPDKIRAAFTMLLLRMYIDRYPHALIQSPSRLFIVKDEEGSKTNRTHENRIYREEELLKIDNEKEDIHRDLLPQFRLPGDGPLAKGDGPSNVPFIRLQFLLFGTRSDQRGSDKFALVQAFIVKYLKELDGEQDPKKKDQNILIGALLETISNLVNFGFVATHKEIKDIVSPLVDLLDGTGDYSDDTPLSIRIGQEAEGNLLLFKSKQQIIKVLLGFNRLRDAYRLSLVMACFQKSYVDIKSKIKSASEEYDEKGVKGAALIEEVEQIPEGEEIGGSCFRRYVLKRSFHEVINDIFEDDTGTGQSKINGSVLDLDGLSPGNNLSAICLDLMQYDSPELFEAAFSLLLSQFRQREPLQEALNEVLLLPASQLVEPSDVQICQPDPRCDGSNNIYAELLDVSHVYSFRKLFDRGIEG